MVETQESLVGRKRDVFAALRALERDRADGVIDQAAYETARDRFEREAAVLLERLDALGSHGRSAARVSSRRSSLIAGGIAGALIVVAVAIFLITALRERGNGTITGDAQTVVATPAPAAAPAVVAALKRSRLHPGSVQALLDLGNAYLSANAPSQADAAFLKAMKLAPSRPEASTMHALIVGETRSISAALTILSAVETAHPMYAHAWLVDGLVASRGTSGVPRAIRAYQRFLVLQPHAKIAAEVRLLLAALERSQRRKP